MTETRVIGPNFVRHVITMLVAGVLMVGGLFMVVGPGSVFSVGAGVIGGLVVFALVVSLIRQRPSVVLTAEGFEARRLFGARSYRWDEIDGIAAVIKIGINKAVAFNLTLAGRDRLGRTKKPLGLSGYDEAIMGNYRLPADQLAAVLNARGENL